MLKVVHYINQFFGQIGGEDKADTPPLVKEGPVGPGLALQQALGDQGKVVATIICGDSYFNEHVDEALAEVLRMVEQYQPDLFVNFSAFSWHYYIISILKKQVERTYFTNQAAASSFSSSSILLFLIL